MAAIVTFFKLCFLAAMNASAAQYEVREGENLTVISRKTGVSVGEIRRANNLSDDRVEMGQRLYIPEAGEAVTAASRQSASTGAVRQAGVRRALPVSMPEAPGSDSSAGAPSPIYTVTDGDTLSSIARRYNTTVSYLQELNAMSGTDIRVGQKLRLRPEAPELDRSRQAPTNGPGRQHVVESGDTLSSLARGYGVKLSQLRQWNALDGDTIRIGQVLQVSEGGSPGDPAAGEAAVAQQKPSQAGDNTAAKLHLVQPGETLFSISRQYSVSVPDLRVANQLRSDSIFAGQKLRIPGPGFDPGQSPALTQTGTNANDAVGAGTVGGEEEGWISPTSRPMQDPLAESSRGSGGSPATWEQPGHYLDLVSPDDLGASAQAHLSEANQTAQPAPTAGGTQTYTVQPNDTLWGISRKFDVGLDRLRAVNNLQGDTIRPGKTLRIP